MPIPFAHPVTWTDDARPQLASLVRAHSTPQSFALRCRLMLRAAAPDQPPNRRGAAEPPCHRPPVGLWRTHYVEPGLAGLQAAPRSGRPRSFSPSERVDVMSIAPRRPAESHCPAPQWSVDAIAATWRHRSPAVPLSRSTLWRLLDAADRKPHRSVSWLKSHAPDCEAKARGLCARYGNAWGFFPQGRLGICTEEKTGRQMLQRTYPPQVLQPGKPTKRAQESSRHGTRVLLASCVVPTCQVGWNLSPTRTRVDFASPLAHVIRPLPDMPRDAWVVDNLHTPWSLDVCRLVAVWCELPFAPKPLEHGGQRRAFLSDPPPKHGFHLTPQHGSWLNQVAWWCGVLARRCLKRGDFCAVENFTNRLDACLEVSNTPYAPPYRWTYTGQPLGRATPFSHTRRQQRQGRAWFSPRPQRFKRAFSPPRPYHRSTDQLAVNL